MKPRVGDVVDFFGPSGQGPYAAIVTAAWQGDLLNLHVLTDGTNGSNNGAFTADEGRAGWAWRTSIHRRGAGDPSGWDLRGPAVPV